jgi:hypothetical protein
MMWQAGGERVSAGIRDAVPVPFFPLLELMGHEQQANGSDGDGGIGDFLHEPLYCIR